MTSIQYVADAKARGGSMTRRVRASALGLGAPARLGLVALLAMAGACASPAEAGSSADTLESRSDALAVTKTDKSAYMTADPVVITYSGALGNPRDWLSISVPGSATTSYVAWMYTGGGTTGVKAFTGVPAGTYVARLHAQGTYDVSAESAPFTMAAAASTVTTDSGTYNGGASVSTAFAGAPGNTQDWISISPPGSPDTAYVAYTYTGGGASGTRIFTNVPAGSYVARLHPFGSYATLAESAAFSMAASGTTCAPTASAVSADGPVTVNLTGMPGNAHDWVSISVPGSATTSYVTWAYTNGITAGHVSVPGVPAGTYVARAHAQGTYDTLTESASFVVNGAATASATATAGAQNTGPAAWAEITSGGSHSCGIGTDGTLWCWGENLYGQLGEGSTTDKLTPTRVDGDTTWAHVAAGTFHTCATKTDASLWCWGYNVVGQIGDGSTADRLTPTQIGTGSAWAKLAVGSFHTCATQTNGALYCWGYNANGQLGDTTLADKSNPTRVGTGSAWKDVAAGWLHTCATQTNGTLYCWGYNTSGQLGEGSTTQRTSPARVGTATTWASITAGSAHTCATRSNGSAWCWGDDEFGQLGDSATNARNTPARVDTSTSWVQLASNGDHTCGAQKDGTAWCWGVNANGQIGDGSTTNQLSPVRLGLSKVKALAAGLLHSCALQTGGALYCWGDNTHGQLGDGTVTSHAAITRIGSAGTTTTTTTAN